MTNNDQLFVHDDDDMEEIENDIEATEVPPEIAMRILGRSRKEEKVDKEYAINHIKVAGVSDNIFSKKTLVCVPTGSGLFKLKFKEGGDVPKKLRGKFTNPSQAQSAVDGYLASQSKVAA